MIGFVELLWNGQKHIEVLGIRINHGLRERLFTLMYEVQRIKKKNIIRLNVFSEQRSLFDIFTPTFSYPLVTRNPNYVFVTRNDVYFAVSVNPVFTTLYGLLKSGRNA